MGERTVPRRTVIQWMGLLGVGSLAGCATLAESDEPTAEETPTPSATDAPTPTSTETPTKASTPTDEPITTEELGYHDIIRHVEDETWLTDEDEWGEREFIYEALIEAKVDLSYLDLTVYWQDSDGVRVAESFDSTSNLRAGDRWQARFVYWRDSEDHPPADEVEIEDVWASWTLA